MTAVHILPANTIAGRAQMLRIADALETADVAWNEDTGDRYTMSRPYLEHLATAALAEMGTKL
ncbi:hypothetical protein AB0L13_16705 [Saccharopolyspora shandongensis]|uniref:hypothetical protein n=1 Tax=Saccharopolyspora shandongensis TaxID=418495 RepID=UPI00344051CB